MTNPEKLYEDIVRLQRVMFPEIEDDLKKHDEINQKIIEEEQKYIWSLKSDQNGYVQASRIPIEDMDLETRKHIADRQAQMRQMPRK